MGPEQKSPQSSSVSTVVNLIFTTVDAEGDNQKTVIPGLVPGIHVIKPAH